MRADRYDPTQLSMTYASGESASGVAMMGSEFGGYVRHEDHAALAETARALASLALVYMTVADVRHKAEDRARLAALLEQIPD